MPIDSKYGSAQFEKAPGEPFGEDEPVFVFRARDKHLIDVLDFYVEVCSADSPAEHLASIMNARARIEEYQKAYPVLVSTPD